MQPFETFFIGGYECADLINKFGDRIDLLRLTGHDVHVLEDYQRLSAMGIRTVREGIRWSFVERSPGVYDFSEVKTRMEAARETGIQQLWDICHFGYPDGLMPTHPHFADRLTQLCVAFTNLYRSCSERPLIITPINEISFLSWLAGDARGTVPFAAGTGFDQKYHLCKAAIRAIAGIKAIDPEAKVMLVEPLVQVHPQVGQETNEAITGFNEAQFQAMDIISGKMCPELGGSTEHMDLAGFNFYYNNQWEHCGPVLGWCKQKRRTSFTALLHKAYQRYNKPVVLSETGHFGADRSAWMELITEDCLEAIKAGIPLTGVCIYPVLDRPDWDSPENLISCGIWTYDQQHKRSVDCDYLTTVQGCHQRLIDCRIDNRVDAGLSLTKTCSQPLTSQAT
jgi:beta-glucosidase/6-phospho-beta-glucosidase/beta-galactosidase